jgi:hypothetical protein
MRETKKVSVLVNVTPVATSRLQEEVFVVQTRGTYPRTLGIVTRFKPQEGEKQPWKAFRADPTDMMCNEYLGCTYHSNGKKAAIDAVVTGDTQKLE